MASIGPQLPPHLQKRKRTPEEETELGSRPLKTSRADNNDEIALDDDSDDDFGPVAPASVQSTKETMPPRAGPLIGPSLPPTVTSSAAAPTSKKRSIGPSLPPTEAPGNGDEISLDSDDNATGPALPPAKAGPNPPPKRVLGPAPPPAPLSELPTADPDANFSEDDSDDDWGPPLPGASTSTKNTSTTLGSTHPSLSNPEPAAAKRDDWMLAPPTSNGPRAPDPTKLKSRKFASGPRAATDGKPAGVSSIWTETPEEKARRLANAVLGREDAHNTPPDAARRPEANSGRSKRDGNRADVERINSYVEQTRGKSLVAEHQAARAAGKSARLVKSGDHGKWGVKGGGGDEGPAEEDDDPSKRAFDWEKDMKVGGQISGSQKRELLNRAANFGGRFQSGKYL
ncbi:hypothetical protein F5144DRAFT_556556 [Chaetomium tenue]|uniref:Uncharacterized protein n=1 Tax=Chaetomium tenue TaxID=1854479 RepID=A0ACB7PSJ6_9PEZI|nr:hypothetical protein F5144DRAFT_556556 [Chaetomium globosum]